MAGGTVFGAGFGVGFDNIAWHTAAGLSQRATFLAFHSHYGVDLFFILSGYLIANLLQSGKMSTSQFLWRRFLRIYPPFLASLLVIILLSIPVFHLKLNATNLLANLFFLNGFFDLEVVPLNPVTWSLFYEAIFYFIAAILYARAGQHGMAWHGRNYAQTKLCFGNRHRLQCFTDAFLAHAKCGAVGLFRAFFLRHLAENN